MARPLPEDLEKQIADTAKRSEVRSVGIWGFILGLAFGFGLGAAFFSETGSSFFFALGAAVIAAIWWLVAKKRK